MQKIKTDFEIALQASLGYHNRHEYKDVLVTLPDQSIYIDTKPEEIAEYCAFKKLRIVVVKQNGVVVGSEPEMAEVAEQSEVSEATEVTENPKGKRGPKKKE